jgi:hypothetical protein
MPTWPLADGSLNQPSLNQPALLGDPVRETSAQGGCNDLVTRLQVVDVERRALRTSCGGRRLPTHQRQSIGGAARSHLRRRSQRSETMLPLSAVFGSKSDTDVNLLAASTELLLPFPPDCE